MTKPDLVQIVCMAALISIAAGVQAEKPLPGTFVPLSLALHDPIDFAAVCVAEDEATLGDIQAGTRTVVQRFRLLAFVVGRTGGQSVGEMRYRMSGDGSERAVRQGERVLWVGRCEGKIWTGVHVFADSPSNRAAVYSSVVRMLRAPALDGLEVHFWTTGGPFERGQPIPVHVQIDNTNDSAMTLWSNFSALQFEVLTEDGAPIPCRRARKVRFDRTEALIVPQHRGPIDTADVAALCDWLPSGGQCAYTLLWRGEVRVGDRKAQLLEVIAEPITLTVLDPATFAWGADGEGVSCGLAAERSDVSMGDRVTFYLGLKSDSLRVDPDLHIYRCFPQDEEVHFAFRNIETKTVYRRVLDMYQGGPVYDPKPEDFPRLREHLLLLWTIPVRLLHESGEQIPAGTYEVTATYQRRQPPETVDGSPLEWSPPRKQWKLHPGPLVSAPVTVRVQHADPESVEVWTNSGIELKNEDGFCSWTGSPENPTILRVTKRPGFGFHAHDVTLVAVGQGEFKRVSSGGPGGSWIGGDFVSSTWQGGFYSPLGPEACRALAAGEPLRVRVDVTINETAEIYSDFSPRADSRVVWQGSLEARRP